MTERAAPTPEPPGEPSGEGSVTVLGTAHVSADSVEEVERTIEEDRPEIVAVELDEGRYRQMKGEAPDDLEPSDLLGGSTVFQFLAYWLLSYVQARLGDQFDIEPGADMLAAIDTAEEFGLGVALVDRDIQTTIQRFWARLSGLEKLKLLGGLIAGVGDPIVAGLTVGFTVAVFLTLPVELLAGPLILGGLGLGSAVPGILLTVIDGFLVIVTLGLGIGLVLALLFSDGEETEDLEGIDMEKLTDADVVTAMMEEFRRFSPGGAEALIDERDAYIAHNLVGLRNAGYDVLAVVGAGHREGIERYLDNPETLPPFESLLGQDTTRRFSLSGFLFKAFGYAFTLGFLAFFILLAMAGVRNGFLLRLFAAWFLINGIISFALAYLAGAHWQSASVGGAVAWLTSVNPLLAPGWFAGYVELRYTTVNVKDISRLNEILDDEEAPIREIFGRMKEVPLFRLILVVAMTNVGSFIASFLFAALLIPYFFGQIGGVDAIVQLMLEGARNSASLLWGLVS